MRDSVLVSLKHKSQPHPTKTPIIYETRIWPHYKANVKISSHKITIFFYDYNTNNRFFL